MRDFFNSWLFIIITWAVIIGAFISYKDEFRAWYRTPLGEATIGDILLIIIYGGVFVMMWNKHKK